MTTETFNPFQPATVPWENGANRKSSLLDRFWAKVRPIAGSSCWGWVGFVMPNGYGQIGNDGRLHYAHRVAYELFVGPIPEAVTQAENNRRAWIVRACNRAEASP